MNSQTFYISKYGQRGALILFVCLILSLVFSWDLFALIVFCCLFLWIVMFRNPERLATHLSPNAFLAPIDGKILEILTQGDRTKIVISVGVLDVGILRSPMHIDHYEISAIHGVPLFFSNKKEAFSPHLSLKFGNHFLKIQQNLFRINPLDEQKSFERGERMGFLKAGKVELELESVELKVNIGDKIRGGESVIGYLK
ncbi:hypothetical protein [Helicobacter pametensis]|uniref:hypothetical protein n=1 Tax=Helicobacter pametensis TaxID=95149 RepID=UPI00048685DC|nr:hypothetical protein [Helicobacter pametensis]